MWQEDTVQTHLVWGTVLKSCCNTNINHDARYIYFKHILLYYFFIISNNTGITGIFSLAVGHTNLQIGCMIFMGSFFHYESNLNTVCNQRIVLLIVPYTKCFWHCIGINFTAAALSITKLVWELRFVSVHAVIDLI